MMTPVTWPEAVVFEGGWQRYRRRVGRGRNDVDFEVKVGDSRLDRYLTLVVRVPNEVGARVARTVRTVAARDPGHYVYPPDDLHLTIIDCSALLAPSVLDVALSRLSATVGDALARTPRARVQLRGLNLFAASVYAQAWDPDGQVRRMRQQLRARFDSPALLRDRVSFVNALRFARPASPVIVRGVAEARRTEFGWFIADKIELVLTDRTLSTSATTVVESYSLGTNGWRQ